jgi:DNA polymerase III epsilon subunit-like protein
MIVFDTETTGLPQPSVVSLDLQPQIIEYAAVKMDSKLKVIDKMTFLCKPSIQLPAIITKITGLKDEDLADKPPFSEFYDQLCEFHLGETEMLAHNVDFDRKLLMFDLSRIGKQFNFPWPSRHICTVEATMHFENKRLKLQELYEMATGKPLEQTHRAMDDVEALLEVLRWLKKKKVPL